MKKLSILILSLIIGITSWAQEAKKTKTPEQKAKAFVKRMKKNVGIRSDQETKLYGASLTKHKNISAIALENSTDAEKKKQKKEIRAAFKKEVYDILDEQQITKWEALRAEKKEKRKAKKNIEKSNTDT